MVTVGSVPTTADLSERRSIAPSSSIVRMLIACMYILDLCVCGEPAYLVYIMCLFALSMSGE